MQKEINENQKNPTFPSACRLETYGINYMDENFLGINFSKQGKAISTMDTSSKTDYDLHKMIHENFLGTYPEDKQCTY